MDQVPNGYTIRHSYSIYMNYLPAYLQMSVMLVTCFSINVLFVFKFSTFKSGFSKSDTHCRIVAKFETADNNLCTKFLSVTLNVSTILYASLLNRKQKGNFFILHYTRH